MFVVTLPRVGALMLHDNSRFGLRVKRWQRNGRAPLPRSIGGIPDRARDSEPLLFRLS